MPPPTAEEKEKEKEEDAMLERVKVGLC